MLDEKLGLLGFFDVRRAKIGCRHSVPIDIAQSIQTRPELRIDRTRIRQREGPTPSIRLRPLNDLLKIGLKMDDRLLPAPIVKLGMVRAMDHV